MAELFNVYCDESCHLEHDGIPVMALGAVWCKKCQAKKIFNQIRAIKKSHGLPGDFEVKWSRVTKNRLPFYLDLVTYFFDEDELHFRGVLVPDKSLLDHAAHQQSHNEWYFKMCFLLLKPIIRPTQIYRVYLDMKDTQSEKDRAKLENSLQGVRFSGASEYVHRVQHIRSHEAELMQLCDLLTGAITFRNRHLKGNVAKLQLAEAIQQRSGVDLEGSTPLRESKFNLLRWQALVQEVGIESDK